MNKNNRPTTGERFSVARGFSAGAVTSGVLKLFAVARKLVSAPGQSRRDHAAQLSVAL